MWKVYGLLAAGIATLCGAQSSFEPLRPPSLPLAVRSPYLSTYQSAGSDGGNGGYLAGQWPSFYNGAITGWTGYIRVDNITYIWMGSPDVTNETNYYVSQQSYVYTPTKSIFTMDVAGLVGMNITFTSPVLPDTILEMSLPYSYMNVDVYSIDGKTHDVQLYSDITAEWVAGDRTATAQWAYNTTENWPAPTWAAKNGPLETPTPTAITTYATSTAYNPTLVGTYAPGGTPVSEPGQGHHYAGQMKPPQGANKHNNWHKPPKTNPYPGGVAYHEVWRQQQLEFASENDQAEWGYWYYATDNVDTLTYQAASDITTRSQFINYGYLLNTENDTFRGIDTDYPTFGFARDLGEVDSSQQSVLFQISLHQQNCVMFEDSRGNQSIPCMWTNYFDNAPDAVGYFYNEHSSIYDSCTALDNQIEQDSYNAAPDVGKDYYAITALATRQAYGALEYTNTPDEPWVFMEEISSDGDIQTVDVMMPMHPIHIYLNATVLKWMLEPIFINTPYFPFQYAMHDLGYFPNATGHNNPGAALAAEQQPVEESGNMLAMALAYAQRANDNAWLAERYSPLRQWTEYLINNTLYPGTQLSTDDFLGPLTNDSNLAVKGIIAIQAMSQIANRTGHVQDGIHFNKVAHEYIQKWYSLAFNYNAVPPHEVSGYQNRSGNYSMLYNLFGDKECGLDLVKPEIYEIQSNFYPTVFAEYGVPLRNTVTSAKTDWEMWAASMASVETRDQFISVIAHWLDVTPTQLPFTDCYNVDTGDYGIVTFYNRPVVGAMFAPLALLSAPTSPTVQPSGSKS